MSVFTYNGVELDLDWLVSYARVSTSQQAIEEGGSGIQRQIDLFNGFAEWCRVPVDNSLGSLVDEGKSGRGQHLEDGAALASFMDATRTRSVKPKTGLVVESFSRLGRLEIDDGMHLFTEIIKSGTSVVSLSQKWAITQKSLRSNQGEIYRVASAIQAARAESDSKVYYSTVNFRSRRGAASNVLPSWIVKTANGNAVSSVIGLKKLGAKLDVIPDPDKRAIIEGIFRSALEMGLNRLAAKLNNEGVPVMNDQKRKRGVALWSTGTVAKLLRGQQVLGLQQVGHYENGKRVLHRGEYVQAYPAVISEELWQAVQIRMDARKTGRDPASGRNVTKMTNIFGPLIRCECSLPMRVHRRGKRGEYVYIGCSAAYDGGCKLDNKRWYRVDHLERTILPRIAAEVVDDKPRADPIVALEKQITKAKAEATNIEQAYQRSMRRGGELAERTQAKLEIEYTAKRDAVAKLERQLAALQTARPASEVQEEIGGLLGAALNGDVAARAKIASALPALIKRIICRKDGTLRVEAKPIKMGWTIVKWQSSASCRAG